MRFIKYFVITLLGLILLAGISLLVFGWYRSYQASKQLIPQETKSLIRVELDKIAFDVLQDEWFGLSSKRSRDTADKRVLKPWEMGVTIPASLNLFAFETYATAYYLLLPVNDTLELDSWLKSSLKLELEQMDGEKDHISYYHGKYVTVLVNQEKALFRFGKGGVEDVLKMREILNNQANHNLLAKDFQKELSEESSSNCFYSDVEGNRLTLEFSKGQIDLKAVLQYDGFKFSNNPVQFQPDTINEIASFQLNADIPHLLEMNPNILSKFNIPIDSIKPYLGNYIGLDWKEGEISQWEEIINYEYDENFEMIEKKEKHEIKAPLLSIRIKASPHLLKLLPNKMFYEFHKSVYTDFVKLATASNQDKTIEKLQPSKHSLILNAKPSKLPLLNKDGIVNFNLMEHMEITGTSINSNKIELDGKILFNDRKTNVLYQLVE